MLQIKEDAKAWDHELWENMKNQDSTMQMVVSISGGYFGSLKEELKE